MRVTLTNAQAIVPGIDTDVAWHDWAQSPSLPQPAKWTPSVKRVPMMTARRMSEGMRWANEVALALSETTRPDALIFSSRHGELARGEKVMRQILTSEPVSPTDFMVSVHNAAVGMFGIDGKLPVPASSVAAGADSLCAGLTEAYLALCSGAQRVLLVDFESTPPERLGAAFDAAMPRASYAVGLMLAPAQAEVSALPSGSALLELAITYRETPSEPGDSLPLALRLYQHVLTHQDFSLTGERATLSGRWL